MVDPFVFCDRLRGCCADLGLGWLTSGEFRPPVAVDALDSLEGREVLEAFSGDASAMVIVDPMVVTPAGPEEKAGPVE